MSTTLETLPASEASLRLECCRALLREQAAQAAQQKTPAPEGLLVTSKVNIYYFTGTLGVGLLWIPLEGEPVLMIRKGVGRAKMESPLVHVEPFRSYAEVPLLCAQLKSPLTPVLAIEKSGLTWEAADLLRQRLGDRHYISGDKLIQTCRMVKSEWELNKLRLCGARHHMCMHGLLPESIHANMTEREIGITLLKLFYEHGYGGLVRLNPQGDENVLGNVAAGVSALYPTSFDGPVGLRGMHSALPYMGDAGTVWQQHELLTIDVAFSLEGYHTDKTQVYWSGPGPIPNEALEAHAVCIEVQRMAASMLTQGTLPSDIWKETLNIVAATPFADTFMGMGENQVRFLGHGIGLHVAEPPAIAKGFDAPLQKGMVLALEPKISLPGLGMVGVENTFVVTAEGGQSLTGEQYEILALS